MGKTLVKEAHPPGTACDTRWCNAGLCGGTATAKWLNELGDDDELYVGEVTCGRVRQNWLHGNSHVIPVNKPWEKPCPTCGGRGRTTIPTTSDVELIANALEFYATGALRPELAQKALAAIRRMK